MYKLPTDCIDCAHNRDELRTPVPAVSISLQHVKEEVERDGKAWKFQKVYIYLVLGHVVPAIL